MTGERKIVLTNKAPSLEKLREEFEDIAAFGLYLHIPFCEQICPYCPYNREIYRRNTAEAYVQAVNKEIDFYSGIVGRKPVTSFYIGGGTPTTMLHCGLTDMIGHIRDVFNLQCEIHMESHPNHLSADNLSTIKSVGVQHLSIGVEALSDRHLKTLCRTYRVEEVRQSVRRAVSCGFKCVNVDVMFALPGQTYEEIEETGHELVSLGVDQIAAYPLFIFPYTHMGQTNRRKNHGIFQSLKRRKMLAILERIFYQAGYERTSSWAFTRRGVPRYCSVTVPLYLGMGASGGSYLRDMFYLNTFGAAEYIGALEEDRLPIALSLELTEKMQKAGWLYWRIYETRFSKTDYRRRFGQDIDHDYGGYLRLLEQLGFLRDDGEQIVLSDRGSFWLHAFEDVLSIGYINDLWGASRRDLWPEKVIL